MAQTLDQARKLSRTNIHGRRFGLDHQEFGVGVKDIRKVVTNATSDTTGTALPNHGFVTVVSTTNDTWTLTDPEIGVPVVLMTGSTSTGTHTISCAAATILSSVSSTFGEVVMSGGAQAITLTGLTTALWGIATRTGTTLGTVLVSSSS